MFLEEVVEEVLDKETSIIVTTVVAVVVVAVIAIGLCFLIKSKKN